MGFYDCFRSTDQKKKTITRNADWGSFKITTMSKLCEHNCRDVHEIVIDVFFQIQLAYEIN